MMGNIINFMEKLGSSAELQELSESDVVAMLQGNNLNPAGHTTLLAAVENLLDPRKNLVCGVMPAEEPHETPQPEEEPEQPDQEK